MDRRKRARTAVAAGGQAPAAKKVAVRPTEDEEHAAERIIALCREVALEPPLLAPKTRADPRVVACGLALYFGEKFPSEAKAKEAFGLGASTEVRRLWAQDKLVRLFEQRPAARKAAAVYFSPIQTTHADDGIWNDDEQEQEASPSTALVLATSTTAEPVVPVSSAQHDADAYARGYEAGHADSKRLKPLLAVLDVAKEREDELEDELSRLRQELSEMRTRASMYKQDIADAADAVEELLERAIRAEKKSDAMVATLEKAEEWAADELAMPEYLKWTDLCDEFWRAEPSTAEVRAESESEAKRSMDSWGPADTNIEQDRLCDVVLARIRARSAPARVMWVPRQDPTTV